MLVQRFGPHGRRFTNFHYYYYYCIKVSFCCCCCSFPFLRGSGNIFITLSTFHTRKHDHGSMSSFPHLVKHSSIIISLICPLSLLSIFSFHSPSSSRELISQLKQVRHKLGWVGPKEKLRPKYAVPICIRIALFLLVSYVTLST